jgi:hypothetical protein
MPVVAARPRDCRVLVRPGGGDCCGIRSADDRPHGVVRLKLGDEIRFLSGGGVFCSGACCRSRLVRCGVDVCRGFSGCCRSAAVVRLLSIGGWFRGRISTAAAQGSLRKDGAVVIMNE